MRRSLQVFTSTLKLQSALGGEKGQALIEYVLMLLVALAVVATMAAGFRKPLIGLWGYYTRQISAACPGCTPNPRYRFR